MDTSRFRVKAALVLGLASLAGFASADRLFNIPTAKPLPNVGYRFEHLGGLNVGRASESFLAFSAFNGVEVEARRRLRDNESGRLTFDLSYNVIGPVAGTSPGISVGILDTFNETRDGIRTYVAFTFRELLEVSDLGENGDFTFGFQTGDLDALFAGFSLPLSSRTKFITEWNGARLTTGFDYTPIKGLSARVFTQDNILLAGISFTRKF